MSRGLGKARGSLLAHGCLVSLFYFLSSRLASQAHLPLRASWSSGRRNFFRQHFPIWSSCWNVSSCYVLVHVRMCRRKKNRRKKNVLVENDAWTRKQKANEKNNPCRSSKKMSKQTDSESSKNIDPGEIFQVGLTDGRRPRCPLLSIATKMVFPGERKPFPFHFAVRVSRADSQLTWTYTCR